MRQRKRIKLNKTNQRIRLLHQRIANKIESSPALLAQASEVLEQRYTSKLMSYSSYLIWADLLALAKQDFALFKQELLAEEHRMEQLRKETIFTGILNEQERREVIAEIYGDDSAESY